MKLFFFLSLHIPHFRARQVPFPGLQKSKSVMTHGMPSISILSPFFRSDALYMVTSLIELNTIFKPYNIALRMKKSKRTLFFNPGSRCSFFPFRFLPSAAVPGGSGAYQSGGEKPQHEFGQGN